MYLCQFSFIGSVFWDENKLAYWEEAFEGRRRKRQCRDEVCFDVFDPTGYYALEAPSEPH